MDRNCINIIKNSKNKYFHVICGSKNFFGYFYNFKEDKFGNENKIVLELAQGVLVIINFLAIDKVMTHRGAIIYDPISKSISY